MRLYIAFTPDLLKSMISNGNLVWTSEISFPNKVKSSILYEKTKFENSASLIKINIFNIER